MPKGRPRGARKAVHCPSCNTEVKASDGESTAYHSACGECGTHLRIKNVDGVGSANVRGPITD